MLIFLDELLRQLFSFIVPVMIDQKLVVNTFFISILFMLFHSCGKSNNELDGGIDEAPKPDATEEEVTFKWEATENLHYFGATIKFSITSGNRNVQSRGVVYGLQDSPTESDGKELAKSISGDGSFEVDLANLSEGSVYYIRPFVTKPSGIIYGSQIQVQTIAYPTPTVYLDSATFSDQAKFEKHWNILYPWGSDHNGSARMYAEQVSLEDDNVLKITADRTEIWEGYSTADPWLRIFYHSGAIHAKQQITVNDSKPYWIVSGDFKVPTMVGSWPAFWITGAWSWPPEIDIMEFKGDNTNWQNTVTGPDWQNTSWQTTKTPVAHAEEWHNYKLIMYKTSSTHIAAELYIDGSKKATHTADFVGKPFWLIINMQMEGASGGHASGPQHAEMQARNIYLAAYDIIP